MTEKPFQHYPKHLYLNGDRTAKDCVVLDEKEEAAARKEGFRMIGDPAPEAKAKK
jgi:hypothetical protein